MRTLRLGAEPGERYGTKYIIRVLYGRCSMHPALQVYTSMLRGTIYNKMCLLIALFLASATLRIACAMQLFSTASGLKSNYECRYQK